MISDYFSIINLHILLQAQAATIVPLIIIIIVCIAISFILAGSEVAFFSLTHKEIDELKSNDHEGGSRRVVALLEQPKKLLSTLLIANSFCNLSIIILSNIVLDSIIPFDKIKDAIPHFIAGLSILEFLIKILLVTFIIVLVCEILPKIWALHYNVAFAKNTAWVVEFFSLLFGRLAISLANYTQSLENKLGGKKSSDISSIEELDHAIDSENAGDANPHEKNILKGILTFGHTTVRQIMRTRMDVSGINANTSFNEVVAMLSDLHYSRLPVYNNTLDEVIGVLHTKDVLPHVDKENDFEWKILMRKVVFVHEQKLIEDLLQQFRNDSIHFAIVVDEFGGTSGIVTLEDILEEIVGDINDEFDEDTTGNKKIDDYNYIIDGRTSINDMCKLIQLPINTFEKVKGESDTVAGLVLEVAGKIPNVGEIILCGDFEFTITEKQKNRIDKLKVTIKKAS